MTILIEPTSGELFIVKHKFDYVYDNADELVISNAGEPLIVSEKWSILKI